ncbi:uncharacterized protein P174DRAFT_455817 [Aspergillus novofumigatus IBT 16806]|uniref:Uncharacterized protein n=1 Tax=Aspergillus novofumigatus (strain IBT 16806) TaxID=1392255 RepID=A0A2I1CK86_ASPN1|nr:uncharacterized protein P174DRAFT_455817 [Aspergillus novofumigatus IBT 16806]PKX98037.1 hypothetical protein P174DRAFT_455817 [Aspergillus novofumigatus IBT 16806]
MSLFFCFFCFTPCVVDAGLGKEWGQIRQYPGFKGGTMGDFLLIASPQDDDDGIAALFSLYGASSTSVSAYLVRKTCLLQNCVGYHFRYPFLSLVPLFLRSCHVPSLSTLTKSGKHADVGSSLPRPGTELSSPKKEKDKSLNGSLSTILLLGLLVLILFSLSVLLQLNTLSPVAQHLIAKHGHPTRVSLSSLRDLTATSSTYNPPSPLSPRSPASEISELSDTVILSRSTSRPIPIPKPPSSPYDSDLPVTPLTGRFEKDYFPQSDQSKSWRNRESVSRLDSDRYHRSSYRRPSSRMRSDSSSFYSPAMSPSMSPSTRSASPQPTRSRPHNSAKSVPAFHLGSLPRFHPAVYQPSNNSQSLAAQPPSPRHSRQQSYWTSSSSRDTLRQYRELVESVTLSRAPSRPLSPSPSAPRLDPLRSPGPVTPLALEETSGYLTIGATSSDFSSSDSQSSSAAPDLVEKLIAREVDRARQKSRKSSKNW